MKLYVLIRSLEEAQRRQTYQLLQKACEEAGVELVPLEQEKMAFDAATADILEQGNAFYRLSTGPAPSLAEQLLIKPGLSTIYESWRVPPFFSSWADTVLMFHKKLPIIPTTFLLASLPPVQIDKIVEDLGGYPVVLKISGKSHGQGVFLCHTLVDIQRNLQQPSAVDRPLVGLRKFVPDARHIRAVVVGNECVDAIEYDVQPGDFRTNAVTVPTAKNYDANDKLRKVAVEAASASGVKFAGVDILIGADDTYIAEVNSPFNFARNYLTNGKNLAQNLVGMLVGQIDKEQ
jgi:hypothetical protein